MEENTVLIEKTSKHLKKYELFSILTLFITIFAGLGLMYVNLNIAFCVWGLSLISFFAFCAVKVKIWWNHG
ncbi:hypothetical protein AAEX28_02360 [Lentisphaerota bacterium WC36G]